jgi:hypothetical protein
MLSLQIHVADGVLQGAFNPAAGGLKAYARFQGSAFGLCSLCSGRQ